ncbi:MAG: Cof-type HAD-IIB family hydrolase [Lachnospiraceae bacterium]|nr:Cof-type HAD-IIB family hydrolase [Lachnospiraceae bacterium]
MIRAIFFDVDGTLLSHKTKEVPSSARRSLALLKERQIKVFLSTGRHALELDELPVQDLTFDGYITLNGQLCLDGDKNILSGTPFGPSVTQALVSMFDRRELPVMLVEKDRIYINYVDETVRQAQLAVSTSVPPIGRYEGAPLYLATTILRREEEEAFRVRLPEGCKIERWSDDGVDIIHAASGKVSGILAVQKALGLSVDEIMAFGDAENDMDMLRYAGIGVAMGNAKGCVKEIADYVTADIDADGIWEALCHFKIL